MASRISARKYPRPTVFQQAPFVGMRDSLDPTAASPIRATLLQNVYPQAPEMGGGIVGRPGFQQAGAQLASGGVVQGFHQFTQLDGTTTTVCIAGGLFYTFDWSTRAWTETLTGVQIAAASVTLSTTARVSFVTFADKLIVSDGVNTPWQWDGTAGGGITELTACPVLFGPPTVYYAKLFGIKNAERSTFVWSEENDPTIGYESGDYNNAWTLGQTDQDPLVAMRGSNEALYYWRERSTGSIAGAVDAEFVTTGTHESVSTTVGTRSPWGIVRRGRSFVFVDADARPQQLVPGGGVVPIWENVRETVRQVPRTQLDEAIAIDYTPANLVLLGVPEVGQTRVTLWIALRGEDGGILDAAGLWRGFTVSAAEMVVDGDGEPVWMHGSTDGYAYDHGNPDGDLWDDELAAGTAAIQHVVQGTPLGHDVAVEKLFDRIDITFRTTGDMAIRVDYETPRGIGSAQDVEVSGSYSRWDEFLWDTGLWSADASETHKAVGLNAQARWIRPRIRHGVVGERFGFLLWRVQGVETNSAPQAA